MTELRDARLKKALEAAPDADVRPAPSVAHAIRTAARNALPTPVPKEAPGSWWLRLWQSTGQPRSAWGAAFATVLVAVLVTVMWVREPIPDARPIAPTAAPAASPAAPAADAPLPEAPTRKSTPLSAIRQEPEKHRLDTAKDESHPTGQKSAPAPAPAVEPAPAPAAAMAPAPAPVAIAPQQSPVIIADQRVQTSKQSELNKAPSAAQLSTDMAGASQRSAARSLAPAALSENMASAKATADVSGSEAWDTLLVQTGERSVKLDRAQGRKLFALMQRLQSTLPNEEDAGRSGPATAPDLLIKVQAQEQLITTFTLSGQLARWSRPGSLARSATLSDAQIAQLTQAVREASLGRD